MDVTLFTFNSRPGFNFNLTIFPKVEKEKKRTLKRTMHFGVLKVASSKNKRK
jgi:hypothetical protein